MFIYTMSSKSRFLTCHGNVSKIYEIDETCIQSIRRDIIWLKNLGFAEHKGGLGEAFKKLI